MKTKILLLLFLLLSVPIQARPHLANLDQDLGSLAQLDEAEKPEHLENLAESLLIQGDFAGAESIANEVLSKSPGRTRSLVVLAKVALTKGEFAVAQRHASELLRLDSGNPDHQAIQGMVYMLSNEASKSITFLKTALVMGEAKKSPAQLASYANTLVLAYHQDKQADLALKTCLDAIKKYPEEADLYLSCSRLYREKTDYQAALEIAQKGLSKNPNFIALYASIALAEAGLGQLERSEQAYQQLQDRDPELAKALRETLDGIRKDSAELKVRVD